MLSPLVAAVENPAAVRILIDCGANVNTASLGQTPLHIACTKGSTEIVKILLAAGSNPNSVDSALQHTSLHAACLGGSQTCVKYLLNFGANVNARAKNGWTPLHRAAAKGHTDICQLLVGNGADSEALLDASPQSSSAARKFGKATPRDLAEAARHFETAAFFSKVTGPKSISSNISSNNSSDPPLDATAAMLNKIAALRPRGGGANESASPQVMRKRAAAGHARARSQAISPVDTELLTKV